MKETINFNIIHNRKNTGSVKYDFIPKVPDIKDVIPMWVADMDFKSPVAVEQALQKVAKHNIYGYTYIDDEYLLLVQNWYKNRMSWNIKKEEILSIPSVMFGISAAIRALTKAGDSVLVSQPVYYPFMDIVKDNARKLVVSPLVFTGKKYEIDFKDFETKIKQNKVKMYILCSPHNPVSRVWTKKELLEIAKICIKHNVIIVSDEIHSDFVYDNYKHYPISSLSKQIEQNTITAIAPTKTFNLAGLQAAHLVIQNKKIREQVVKSVNATGFHVLTKPAIEAVKAVYRDGESWFNTLLKYLQRNRDILVNDFAGTKISVQNMEGTYLAWLNCKQLNLSCGNIEKLFLKAGVWLHKGSTFGTGGEGYMRLNLACSQKTLKTAIKQIKQVI
ncbi:MAG: pyridoxal phosphate-dependent aminotransferase [Endomicrobiaceae bacterium]|nr:pyridoxal phosphate-dependent aminotransferase [Endomicrobiaceae bacterium]